MESSRPREHNLTGADGWRLNVLDYVPEGVCRAVVIAGHAMMVDRRTLCRRDRQTLVQVLVERGLRVFVPEIRGRGKSGPIPTEGGDWTYDQVVGDIASYLQLVRQEAPGQPVFLVGHSLFGHASLAYMGQNNAPEVQGLVALSVRVWLPRWTRPGFRCVLTRIIGKLVILLSRFYGYFPARRLRVGTADEALSYWEDLHRWVREDRWGSRKGLDYGTALSGMDCPLLHVVSQGDRLICPPAEALRMTEVINDRRDVLVIGGKESPLELDGFTPNHMEIVTSSKSQ